MWEDRIPIDSLLSCFRSVGDGGDAPSRVERERVVRVERIGVVIIVHALAFVFGAGWHEVAHLRQPVVGIVAVRRLLPCGVRLRRDQVVAAVGVRDRSIFRIRRAWQESCHHRSRHIVIECTSLRRVSGSRQA